MRKIVLLLVLFIMVGSANALTDISAGLFGGLNFPVVQDDAKSGNGFGLKAKFAPTPMIGGSIFYESRSFGDPEITVLGQTMTTDGGKVTAIGAEAMIGNVGGAAGPHFYWSVGITSYKWKRDNFEDLSKVDIIWVPGSS